MTNFDDELDDMNNNQFENHKQKEIFQSFMDFMLDDLSDKKVLNKSLFK
jgi:hypothetical protein